MWEWTIDEPTTLAFDEGAVRRARIDVINGAVHVLGTDEVPSLEISHISGEELKVRLDDDGVLEIGYDRAPERGPFGLFGKAGRSRVELALAVHRECAIDGRVVAGSAMVSAIEGRVHLHGVSSDATLVGLTGDVQVDTVSGAVEAERISGEFRIKTISGDVTVVEESGTRLGVETVSGAVALDLAEPLPEVRVETVSGDATLRIPYESNLDARLTTTSGQVASTFAEVKHGGWPGAKSADGRIGSGGPLLRAHTVSGHVTLLGRDGGYEPARPAAAEDGGAL